MLTISLPYLPPPELSPNSRLHWAPRRRAREAVKDDVKALVLEQGWQGPPMQCATISISFGLPDRRVRDDDNMMANGMNKAILDALTGKARALDAKGKANGPWLPERFVLQEDDRNHARVTFGHHQSPGKPQTIIEIREAE